MCDEVAQWLEEDFDEEKEGDACGRSVDCWVGSFVFACVQKIASDRTKTRFRV